MPTMLIEGDLKYHYQDAGSGSPALVLLHGFPFTSDLWRPQIQALSPTWRVITPDFRGFGASDPSPSPYQLGDLADDVAALLTALQIRKAVIGGLSMGGYVAFELCRRHPARVAALILADTRPDPDTPEARQNRATMAELARQDGTRAVVQQLLPKLLSSWTRAQKRAVEAELRDMMEAADPEAIAAALLAMGEREDSRPLLRLIDVPVLVIAGAEDQLTPAEEARAWAAQIPHAQMKVIQGAGHVSSLEQADKFNALVRDFLAGPAAQAILGTSLA